MKRVHMIGLALVAAVAFSAVVVATASAAKPPEILFKLQKGKFPGTFTSEGGKSTLELKNKKQVTCEEVSNKGTIGGKGLEEEYAHLGTVEIKFKGCKAVTLSKPCKSSGAAVEEIVVPSSLFHLGLAHSVTNSTIPAILILLPGGTVAEPLGGAFTFECGIGAAKIVVKGDVVGELKLPSEPAKEAKLSFKQKETGVQEFNLFLLSLIPGSGAAEENERTMLNQDLKTKIENEPEELSGETSEDKLKEFKNSKGEADELLLVLEKGA